MPVIVIHASYFDVTVGRGDHLKMFFLALAEFIQPFTHYLKNIIFLITHVPLSKKWSNFVNDIGKISKIDCFKNNALLEEVLSHLKNQLQIHQDVLLVDPLNKEKRDTLIGEQSVSMYIPLIRK